MFKTQMTAADMRDCTDDELQRIVRMARIHAPRFAVERNLALVEMGRRVAAVIFAQARADRAAARERARRLGCAVQEDFLDH